MERGIGVGQSWRARVLWLSFVESFATILLERGLYFFSHERLGYSETENLALAAGFGATYTVGATLSHVLSRRAGDRATLFWTLGVLLWLHLSLYWVHSGLHLPIAFALVGLVEGAK